jgi:peptide/nickel transport system permease protein
MSENERGAATSSLRHSPHLRLLARRTFAAIPVLIGVSLLTFFVVNVLPGDTAQMLAGLEATPEQVARLKADLHLDTSVWQRYGQWLAALSHGDLGDSLASGQPVATLVGQRLPVTFELVTLVLIFALGLAIPLALLAAIHPDGLIDRLIVMFSAAGMSVANYALALLLILIFAVHLRLFPAIGFTGIDRGLWQNLRSLTLPGIALAVPLSALYTRFLRNDLVEQLQGQEYIVAATARGLSSWRVLIGHALRNSLFGLLTLVGLHIGPLIGGAVIIEQIFAVPGVGQLLLQAVSLRDTVLIQGVVLVLTATTVIANLAVDLLYSLLDPRIRYE